MFFAKSYLKRVLASANIQFNGVRPWDIQVHDERLFHRVIRHGSLGLGEAYVEGWWDCEALDHLFYRILEAELDKSVKYSPSAGFLYMQSLLTNRQNGKRAYDVARRHYDIGNDLYRIMLDRRMIYSCGYWAGAGNLDQAQDAKLELVCRKLGLKPAQRILDIGCGWGGFAKYAAENYGVEVVGVTVSEKQVDYARELCKELSVDIRLQDYREVKGTFDHVVSLGMIEHVGSKNYKTYFRKVRKYLSGNGLFLLQTIGSNTSRRATDPWISQYIFPNSMTPSAAQLTSAMEGLFVMEDWHNFGTDYDKTLIAWHENIEKGRHQISHHYPEEFFRLWRYYLLMCAGSFRARKNQLWQLTLSKSGVKGGYHSPRYYSPPARQAFVV